MVITNTNDTKCVPVPSSPPPISEHNSASFHRRSGISTLKCAALCGAQGGPAGRANLEQFYNYCRGKMIQRNTDDVMSIGTGRYIFRYSGMFQTHCSCQTVVPIFIIYSKCSLLLVSQKLLLDCDWRGCSCMYSPLKIIVHSQDISHLQF